MDKIYKITNLLMLTCFTILVGVVSFTEFSDFDYWWHMKKGEVIAEKGDTINPDTFSYTFSGQPDENSEWLADLLIYQSYNFGGLVGSNLFKAFILILTFLFLLETFRTLSKKKQLWLISSFRF